MTYSSKILLFGEHIVIKGAQALVVPFSNFKGNWEKSNNEESFQVLQMNLKAFGIYLKNIFSTFEQKKFEEDLRNGVFFNSNIPTGYGLGSSGAVVAAVYDCYFYEKIVLNTKDAAKKMSLLKSIFSKMESFFHGSSSGIDPLICYVNRPIWLQSKAEMNIVQFNKLKGASLFLLDTKMTRSTSPFVNIFLKKVENFTYKNAIKKELFPVNNRAIQEMINGEGQALFNTFHEISQLQKEYFVEMIPDAFQGVWDKGLDSNLYRLKLCGAGGGGFFLGITNDFEETKNVLKDYSLLKITN